MTPWHHGMTTCEPPMCSSQNGSGALPTVSSIRLCERLTHKIGLDRNIARKSSWKRKVWIVHSLELWSWEMRIVKLYHLRPQRGATCMHQGTKAFLLVLHFPPELALAHVTDHTSHSCNLLPVSSGPAPPESEIITDFSFLRHLVDVLVTPITRTCQYSEYKLLAIIFSRFNIKYLQNMPAKSKHPGLTTLLFHLFYTWVGQDMWWQPVNEDHLYSSEHFIWLFRNSPLVATWAVNIAGAGERMTREARHEGGHWSPHHWLRVLS